MSEQAAQQLVLLAQAAIKRGHLESGRDLATRVIGMDRELPLPTVVDGQRRHRLVAAAIALAVDAELALGRADKAEELALTQWESDPADPYVAAALIRLMGARALEFFHLECKRRVDGPDVSDVPVCMTICRNEIAQLPSFLAHHRRLGVQRFILIDNGSTDGTLELARSQPDVDVWTSDLHFRTLALGANAFSAIAHVELRDRWLLLLDADERFVPPLPGDDLRAIVAALAHNGHEALPGVLLDVYDEAPLLSPRDPVPLDLENRVYFDRVWSHTRFPNAGPFANAMYITGGVRLRVFGPSPVFVLNKVPLIKFTSGRLLCAGQHHSNAPSRVTSSAQATVLHTKFLGANDRMAAEAARGAYPNAASDYVSYTNTLTAMPELALFDPAMSIRYEGPAQLLELGIARA